MSQRRIPASGLLLALMALVAQLAFGAVVPRPEIVGAWNGAAAICHAADTSDEAPPVPHHPSDCLVCPLCISLAAPAFAPPTGSVLPAPRVVVIARAAILPPATAPPVAVRLAARPRGPPSILA